MGFKGLLLLVSLIAIDSLRAQIYEFTAPKRLDGFVNSSADESNPVFSSDGKTLYIVRTFDQKNAGGIYDQDIWVSKKSTEGWGIPFPLKALNNKLNNAVVAD
jgi:hypothetical protein